MLLPALMAMSLLGCASHDDLTVWKESFPSPDGSWVATAQTVQNGGFGSASIDTSVVLQRTGGKESTLVLSLACDGPLVHPYKLDNIANRGGSVELIVRWLDGAHLHLTFQNHPRIQSVRSSVGPVVVQVEDRSGERHAL